MTRSPTPAGGTGRCRHAGAESTGPATTRRRLLGGAVALASTALAGCLGNDEDEEPPEPIGLDDGQSCDVCGMLIADHYGPAGQVFYGGGEPADRDGPARFDSVRELVVFDEEHRERGWERRAAFVTDYSAVGYDLVEGDGTLHVSTHAEREAFERAAGLHYVVGSDVEGAMGPEYLPFSDRADAEGFVADHGGDVRGWGELVGDA